MSRFTLLLLILVLLLTGCNSGSPAAVAVPAGVSSQAAVRYLNLDAALTLVPTPEIPTPVPTPTRRPSATPQPTQAASSSDTPPASSPTPSCTNRFEFVRHLNINPNARIDPGLTFAKVWQVRNSGTCTWTMAYALVFAGGYPLDAIQETPLPHEVKPGETVDLRVQMVAPMLNNTYSGLWLLRDPEGNLFGGGELADQPLEVLILINSPPPTKNIY